LRGGGKSQSSNGSTLLASNQRFTVLIDIEDLEAGYNALSDKQVVVRIDRLNIAQGEHTLLLGPSGSGKTTLLNVLSGLALPLKGTVRIDGVSIGTHTAAQRDKFRGQKIGLVMQRLHLISALNVENNLLLAQRLAGLPHDSKRIIEVLTALQIEDKAHKFPRSLSQGEAQRVAIARAVLNRPKIVLADEPTSALDDANCHAAIDLLFAQAREHGATLIVATHDARIKRHFARVQNLGAAT
jgi:putative ABC transport system ATP-binding protein